MESIGERIKKARESAGMTQEQLGELLGVTGVSVMRYEKGTRQPSINQRLLLAEIFRTPILYFIDQDIYEEIEIESEALNETESIYQNRLISAFELLNDNGKQKALERVEELSEIPKYQRQPEEGEKSAVDPQEDN